MQDGEGSIFCKSVARSVLRNVRSDARPPGDSRLPLRVNSAKRTRTRGWLKSNDIFPAFDKNCGGKCPAGPWLCCGCFRRSAGRSQWPPARCAPAAPAACNGPGRSGCAASAAFHLGGQLVHVHQVAGGQHGGALHAVFQLPHIARPIVAVEQVQRFGRQAVGPAVLPPQFLQKEAGVDVDVLPPLPQGRGSSER